MSDKRKDEELPKGPKPEGTPHKVDEAVQEEAGEERSETGGYE